MTSDSPRSSPVPALGRWLRTARHLEPAQFWHRGRLTLQRAWCEWRGPAAHAGYAAQAPAHNTLQLDSAELLEAWGSFRTGRRGRASVRARGAAGGFEWLHAGHDAWSFLPGHPRHERLLAISQQRILVLDVVLGTGRRRVRSALHLHPDFPPDRVHLVPLGTSNQEAPVRLSAPLHEHFNQTREMTEVALESEVVLPWVGGFILGLAGPEGGWQVAFENGVVAARAAAVGLELRWHVMTPIPEGAVTVPRFEVTHGSAT